MKNLLITKTATEKGYAYKTNFMTRNDKRDFKYALLHVLGNGNNRIWKLCNDAKQMEREFNTWYMSHAIAVEIESGKILWEKTRA